jgi:hypothetical protein
MLSVRSYESITITKERAFDFVLRESQPEGGERLCGPVHAQLGAMGQEGRQQKVVEVAYVRNALIHIEQN